MATPLNVKEWMKGYIGAGASSYDEGFLQGIDGGTRFAHEVLIHMDDVDRFIEEPGHEATMEGHIECDLFGGKRPVVGGTFNMLLDREDPKLKIMLYRMPFTDGGGRRLTMLGHKTIHRDRAFDLLNDIMRLYIRIFDGDVPGPDIATSSLPGAVPPAGVPLAMGVLHIEVADGIRIGRTFRSPGSNPIEAAAAVGKFGAFYFEGLWKVFGKSMRVETS